MSRTPTAAEMETAWELWREKANHAGVPVEDIAQALADARDEALREAAADCDKHGCPECERDILALIGKEETK